MTKKLFAMVLSIIVCCTFTSCESIFNKPTNDTPPEVSHFSEMLTRIEMTMNTTSENILVKTAEIKYTVSGKVKEAKFNVWIYNGTKNSDDYWIEKDIYVTSDNTVSFNIINEEIILMSEYNPKNDGSMQTIDEIIDKIELSILQFPDIDKAEVQPEYYVLTMCIEKYVEYVANSNSGVEYWQESNTNFIIASKPQGLSPESYYPPDKDYFVIVPFYQKNSIENFIFEEEENLVSANYKVLLFNK